MSGTILRLPKGRTIELGGSLGKGAEGVVREIVGTDDLCAKLYFDPSPALERRLEALKHHPAAELRGDTSEHVHLAWPLERLVDQNGETRGFVMPRIEGERLTKLLEPDMRFISMREPTWRSLVGIAGRTAKLLDTLHQHDIVMGDVSPANIMVDSAGLVTLIDCDTVQFSDPRTGARHSCSKLTPDYCPPEIGSGRDLDEAHDEFGLAILVCEMLMEGQHPFHGVPVSRVDGDSDTRENITAQNNRLVFPERLVKVPDLITPDVLSPAVLALARACFGPGHGDPEARPAAGEWAEALGRLESELSTCRVNANHFHHRGLGRCVWCERIDHGWGDSFPLALGPTRAGTVRRLGHQPGSRPGGHAVPRPPTPRRSSARGRSTATATGAGATTRSAPTPDTAGSGAPDRSDKPSPISSAAVLTWVVIAVIAVIVIIVLAAR
ncbi:hypothetical protein GCM10010472_71250 [Pseudonocardia halophobica]|uniref:Protein kinase domain-containing protein n=1 Tax=Pseudonocardia halophobica TaxID=29401 RepID=A0A9W6L0H9_9PSEU|nr:protein kinase [Pseudonocardia halophobica]GLL11003.1 hypothetical protein GCM10017577_21440 [Pseudonocardia halophobica]